MFVDVDIFLLLSAPTTTSPPCLCFRNNYVSGLKTLNEMGNTSNFPISYDFLQ
jgi:hypothetical protein